MVTIAHKTVSAAKLKQSNFYAHGIVLTQSRTLFNIHVNGCVRGEGSVNIYILCGRSCLLLYVAYDKLIIISLI